MDRGAWGATVCGVAELDTTEQLTLSHVRFTILTILKCPVARCVCVRLFVTPWTVACQVPLFMEFSRQEYWSGCHSLLQDLLNPGSKPGCPAWQADCLSSEPPGKPKYTGMQYLSCLGKTMNIYEPISPSIILL